MRECVYVFFTECKATIAMNKTHFYRSCFAFGQDHRLRNSAGEHTTILFGFLSTLLSLLELQCFQKSMVFTSLM